MHFLDLTDKTVLITGGTGSLGQKLVERILKQWPGIKKLIIYSRDEHKQYHMAQKFSPLQYKCLRYFIGDIRDKDRLIMATEGVDYIIHTAALKHVPIAEYNPMEPVKTNILGAENLIMAALHNNVKRVVALSTDKAAAPINLYGATKLVSDKLFIAANNIKGKRDIRFSVVRYGNVMGSQGSVIPFFMEKRKTGVIPITSPQMTRFNISIDEGVELVLYALAHAWGGEIFVPKIPSYRIMDLAEAIAPECRKEIIGIRPGEKIHEEMITSSDSYFTYDIGPYYVILPTVPTFNINEFIRAFNATKVKEGFQYNSGTNPHFLTVGEIRMLIRKHLYPDFTVSTEKKNS